MRTLSVVLLLALLAPAAAFAQGAASGNVPPAARAARGGDISRDEYVQRAVDRARRAAETRFDRMDANHDGILTADERRAARAAKRGGASQSQ
jgi:hypothetical protein